MLRSSDQKSSVAYSVRVSTRAKRARIEVSAIGQVKVIVPTRFNQNLIPAFVAQHQSWIDKTLRKVEAHRPPQQRPDECLLRALNERWRVEYAEDLRMSCMRIDDRQKQITLSTRSNPRLLLVDWLHQYARHHLTRLLKNKSAETGLVFNKLFIKNQKTRWGSCSSKGNINLNRNLLFLPQALVNYVLVHELCHTMHLNHSARFWRLVERYQPSYHQYDKQLHHAHRYIPAWAFPD